MVLLDTHAFLWYINRDEKLPASVRAVIDSAEEPVFVSIGSFWEMAIKDSLGKLRLPAPIAELMEDCRQCGFSILPIEAAALARLKSLPRIHGDPFDRLLICQALAHGLTLLTADDNIARYDVSTSWGE